MPGSGHLNKMEWTTAWYGKDVTKLLAIRGKLQMLTEESEGQVADLTSRLASAQQSLAESRSDAATSQSIREKQHREEVTMLRAKLDLATGNWQGMPRDYCAFTDVSFA